MIRELDDPVNDGYPQPCDWCDQPVWPGDQIRTADGGRFCSTECQEGYADDYAAHQNTDRRTA